MTKLIGINQHRIQEMFLSFGLGLAVWMLINHFLVISGLFYPIITWLIFIAFGVITYLQKKDMTHYGELLKHSIFDNFSMPNLNKKGFYRVLLVLFLLSIMYYYYGFNLSFIPYSTAWDANHAYMYIPKIFAEYHGAFSGGPGGTNPMLRYSYIAYRFSLIEPIKSRFRLSPDNIAVSMNFLSGLLVLIFGLGVSGEAINLFQKNDENEISESDELRVSPKKTAFAVGWMYILLWLTSGMGAFLVFVDNKTDLGVMAVSTLAILSGLIFINLINKKSLSDKIDVNILKYVGLSALMFVIASMAKPTALQDVLIFGMIMVGLRVSILLLIGVAIFMIGLLAKMKVLTSINYFDESQGASIMKVGGGLSVIGLLGFNWILAKLGIKNKNSDHEKTYSGFFTKQLFSLRYIAIWAIMFVVMLFVLKGPQILYTQILAGSVNLVDFIKSLLLG